MQLPLIHSNGTSKESLVNKLCAASNALDSAYQALKETAPNARDYYPLINPEQLFNKAIAEHMDRLKRLDQIKEDIDQLTIAIDRM